MFSQKCFPCDQDDPKNAAKLGDALVYAGFQSKVNSCYLDELEQAQKEGALSKVRRAPSSKKTQLLNMGSVARAWVLGSARRELDRAFHVVLFHTYTPSSFQDNTAELPRFTKCASTRLLHSFAPPFLGQVLVHRTFAWALPLVSSRPCQPGT